METATETTTDLQAISLASLPALRQPIADGLYGGVITLPDSGNYVVVYLHNAKPPKKLKFEAAREWAKSIGAQLVTRAIGSLLVSTLGDLLPQEWVWTEEELDSTYAWYCGLDNGDVYDDDRSSLGGAVAVRLIPLIP